MRQDFGSSVKSNAVFVDVNGTPPAAGTDDYFQAIDAAS
jgi:hypothetical protein